MIYVIGSSNTDLVINAPRIPLPGETILGSSFIVTAGGKGANQAVAAARLGGAVSFITRTGNDSLGEQTRSGLLKEGINLSLSTTDPAEASGVAMIIVDAQGQNSIVVAGGANQTLSPDVLQKHLPPLTAHDTLLLQLEIPIETVALAARLGKDAGARVILNPAPAQDLPSHLMACVSVLTPNETEATLLTGIQVTDAASAGHAARMLRARGAGTVIITLGDQGAVASFENEVIHVPALPVKAVDSTAAGDVFNGALAVGLAENMSLGDAMHLAIHAAAISVTRRGAQQSAPYRSEIPSLQ